MIVLGLILSNEIVEASACRKKDQVTGEIHGGKSSQGQKSGIWSIAQLKE
jgi:hypothetical protein